jgi:hypothetical protein
MLTHSDHIVYNNLLLKHINVNVNQFIEGHNSSNVDAIEILHSLTYIDRPSVHLCQKLSSHNIVMSRRSDISSSLPIYALSHKVAERRTTSTKAKIYIVLEPRDHAQLNWTPWVTLPRIKTIWWEISPSERYSVDLAHRAEGGDQVVAVNK